MKKKLFIIGVFALMLTLSCACFQSKDNQQSEESSFSSSESTSISEESSSSIESSKENSEESTSSESSSEESSEESTSGETSSEESSEESSSSIESSEEEKEVYWTVTFDTDGGTEVEAVCVLDNGQIEKPADPQKISKDCEYEFLGWYCDGVAWDFEADVVTENIILTAQWKLKESYTSPFLPKD